MTRSNDRLRMGVLLAFFELCISIALIPRNTTRWFITLQILLLGCLLQSGFYVISKMTTGSPLGDIAVGSVLGVQLLIALDGIYFTNPNALKNLQVPSSGKRITQQPILERIRWIFEVYTNLRGIGWEHEPSDLPKRFPPETSRRKFVLDRLMTILVGVVSGCFACILNASNPGLTTPNRRLSESQWIWRFMTVVGLGLGATSIMNTTHGILSVVAVGFGLTRPERWPNLFGSPLEAWNLQNVWRKVWHQMLRKPFLAATHFILVKTLGLPPLSHKTNNTILDVGNKLLWLYTPFFISGLIHMAGEYMLLGKMGYGALTFFLLQAVGITLEKVVSFTSIWLRLRSDNPPSVCVRCVGYIYVMLWLSWSLAFYVDPMVNTDIFVCPRCDLRIILQSIT